MPLSLFFSFISARRRESEWKTSFFLGAEETLAASWVTGF
jgi:hypothetical protein